MRGSPEQPRDISELELPAFDYTDGTVVGERFHESMEGLRRHSWVAKAGPVGYLVLDQEATTARGDDIEDALERLNWTGASGSGHDRDWLAGWLYTPRRAGRYVVLDGDENDSALVRRAIAQAPSEI